MVGVVNDGLQIVSCRSGDDDLLCASVDMSLSFCLGGIETGALQNNIDIKFFPRKVMSICLFVDLDLGSVYDDGMICAGYKITLRITSLRRIILQKISKHIRAGQIVDSDNLKAFCLEHLTECKTSDTTKTVNCNFYCHNSNSS